MKAELPIPSDESVFIIVFSVHAQKDASRDVFSLDSGKCGGLLFGSRERQFIPYDIMRKYEFP